MRNQLGSISGLYTANFTYDPFGRRLQKTISGATTNFLYDGVNPVQELSGTTVTANLLTGLGVDEYFTRTDSTGTSNFLSDALGSAIALADPTGTVQTQYTYDPHGGTTAQGTASANSYEFTGRENDGDGLYYYRARYYVPSTGRFLSEDPWDAGPMYDDSNLYEYVEDDPVSLIDPFGMYTMKHGVPAPSPALGKLLTCMEDCIGVPIVVTSTTNGHHQDPGHAAGTSVDIRPPAGVPASKVFCCAGKCGAAWGLNEGPGGGSYKYTRGYNYHFQLKPPHHPSPKAPNAIPPGCKPGGKCSSRE